VGDNAGHVVTPYFLSTPAAQGASRDDPQWFEGFRLRLLLSSPACSSRLSVVFPTRSPSSSSQSSSRTLRRRLGPSGDCGFKRRSGADGDGDLAFLFTLVHIEAGTSFDLAGEFSYPRLTTGLLFLGVSRMRSARALRWLRGLTGDAAVPRRPRARYAAIGSCCVEPLEPEHVASTYSCRASEFCSAFGCPLRRDLRTLAWLQRVTVSGRTSSA